MTISVLEQNRLRWYGHVLREEDNDWVKKCMEYEVEGARPRGRPKKTWRKVVQKDYQACKLNRKDAMDRSRWMKLLNDGWWSRGLWVGEPFFWLRSKGMGSFGSKRGAFHRNQLCGVVILCREGWRCSSSQITLKFLVYFIITCRLIPPMLHYCIAKRPGCTTKFCEQINMFCAVRYCMSIWVYSRMGWVPNNLWFFANAPGGPRGKWGRGGSNPQNLMLSPLAKFDFSFLADRTIGRAFGTVCRLSFVVCLWRFVLWQNGTS